MNNKTKADKIEHVKSNLEALNFTMNKEDYQELNDFRCEEFDKLSVDWSDRGGALIYKFANKHGIIRAESEYEKFRIVQA